MRDEVVRVAAEVFAARGSKATLQDVAAALNMSRPALYRYFPSKEALISEVVNGSAAEAAAIVEKVRASGDPIHDQLHDLVRRLVLFCMRRPAQMRLMNSWGPLPTDSQMDSLNNHLFFVEAFRDLVTQGITAGLFRAVDPAVAAHSIVLVTRGVPLWFLDEASPEDEEQVAEQIATTAVAGILAQPTVVPPELERAACALSADVEALRRAVDSLGG